MRENTSVNGSDHSVQPALFEYLLIVSPAKEVYDKVMEEKQHFYLNYRQPIAIKTKPHITISNFLAKERMEDTLIRWMQRAAAEQESFSVSLNNYSGFPNRAVFLRVQDHTPFRKLITSLKAITAYIKDYGCPAVHFSYTPHLTIARNLSAEVYEKAIWDYSSKDFNASFDVKELVLLRKQYGNNYESYKKVAVLNLKQHYITD